MPQKTSTGIKVFNTIIEKSDYDNLDYDQQLQDYSEMRNGDPIISASLKLLKLPMLRAGYRFDHEIINNNEKLKEAIEYLEFVFKHIKFDNKVLPHKLLALDYGSSWAEKIWKITKFKGKTTKILDKLAFFQNETIWEYYYDDNNNFLGIKHEKRGDRGKIQYIDILSKKLSRWTFNEEFEDVRGNSILRVPRLVFNIKKQVLINTGISTQRGSGIPYVVETDSNIQISETEKSSIKTALKYLSVGKNSYIYLPYGLKLDLLSVNSPQDNTNVLAHLDKQLFFSFLTEFLSSGVESSGSRASASVHYTSFINAAEATLTSLEANIQELVDEILLNSPYYKYVNEIFFRFNSIKVTDLVETSTYISNLINSTAIELNEEDKKYIKDIFGFPSEKTDILIEDEKQNEDKNEEISVIEEESNIDETQLEKHNHDEGCGCKLNKHYDRTKKLSKEKLSFEKLMFNKELFQNQFNEVQTDIEKIMDDFISDKVDAFSKEIKSKGTITSNTINSNKKKFIEDIFDISKKSFGFGQDEALDELEKLANIEKTKLPEIEKSNLDVKFKKKIARRVDILFSKIKNAVGNDIDENLDEILKNPEKFFSQYKDFFKMDKRALITQTQESYFQGRDILNNVNEAESFMISTVLDENVCEPCVENDGEIVTKKQVKDMGLKFNKGAQSSRCLGKERCRCILIPYQLEFIENN